MPYLVRGLAFILLSLGLSFAPTQRSVSGQVVTSTSLPEVTITVSPDLRYVGDLSYKVGDVADADEQVYGAATNGNLVRAFVAHFEHFLPTNDRVFEYPRLTMVSLAGHEYLHQTWAIRQFDFFTEPAMLAFLRQHGLKAEQSWLVDRYVRAVDPQKKNEIILFYLEAASINPTDIHYGGAPVEPPPPPTPAGSAGEAFVRRARAAFQVTDTVR